MVCKRIANIDEKMYAPQGEINLMKENRKLLKDVLDDIRQDMSD